jgi:hypothetical protein
LVASTQSAATTWPRDGEESLFHREVLDHRIDDHACGCQVRERADGGGVWSGWYPTADKRRRAVGGVWCRVV